MSKEIEYPRRCLECEHYELEPYDENITYKCGLSKAKRDGICPCIGSTA